MNVPGRRFRLFVGWLRRLKHGPHDGNMGWFDLNALGDQSLGDTPGERIGMLGKIVLIACVLLIGASFSGMVCRLKQVSVSGLNSLPT